MDFLYLTPTCYCFFCFRHRLFFPLYLCFTGAAIVEMAMVEAGCDGQGQCDKQIFGFKATSILTNLQLYVGLISAIFMPFAGAIVDNTRFRWHVGAITAAIMVCINAFQIAVWSKLWMALLVTQGLQYVVYTVHNVIQFAYLPELTTDIHEMSKFNAAFNSIQFGSIFVYVLLILLMATFVKGITNFQVAQVSQIILTCYSLIMFGYSWTFLFSRDVPFTPAPKGSNLCSLGFNKIYTTAKQIFMEEKSIMWLMLSISLSEAVLNSFPAIFVTLFKAWLEMNSKQIATSNLIMLAFALPGSYTSIFLLKKFDAKKAQQISLCTWTICIILASLILQRPGVPSLGYVTSILWGISYGIIYPCQRTLYSMIVPIGKSTEWMGFYVFCGKIFESLPNLIFVIMNERNVAMNWSLLSLCIFFLGAALVIFAMADFDELVERAKQVSTSRKEKDTEEGNSEIYASDQ
mmetsp:Transcript_41967/g.98337  ORF Transcript_41967/g.98337 Transcript_41967/m.98337 type:complete len:462 (-) Transcript_41967:181-1566(-)